MLCSQLLLVVLLDLNVDILDMYSKEYVTRMCFCYETIILFTGSGEPLLNKIAHVNIADIEAENGVVHVISHVLIPSTVANIVG